MHASFCVCLSASLYILLTFTLYWHNSARVIHKRNQVDLRGHFWHCEPKPRGIFRGICGMVMGNIGQLVEEMLQSKKWKRGLITILIMIYTVESSLEVTRLWLSCAVLGNSTGEIDFREVLLLAMCQVLSGTRSEVRIIVANLICSPITVMYGLYRLTQGYYFCPHWKTEKVFVDRICSPFFARNRSFSGWKEREKKSERHFYGQWHCSQFSGHGKVKR